MINRMKPLAAAAAAALLVTAAATAAAALEVRQVQLGVVDLGGSACPRDAKVTAWAHTDGPGVVKFVIRNDSGGKTGEIPVNAVKGPAGNFLATYSQTFKIQTDTDIKYMAEAVGHGKISNWVNFSAECGPQPRKTTSTTSGNTPKGKHISELDKPQPRKTTNTAAGNNGPKGKPLDQDDDEPAGKPAQNASKPIPGAGAECKPTVSATRMLAATRAGGIATAQASWQATAAAWYGAKYARWSNADDQSTSCTRKGLTFDCEVSARPCLG